jgi:hypothetical protein
MPATRRKATAPTSILFSSRWPDPKAFRLDFEIGFPLPSDKHSAEIAGYHCWSDFYIDGRGWIPVDISEAWKHQEKHDYFFGSHDVNRMQFSMGRDLRLNPAQEGKPLNYFVYPYVEVDGQEYPNVSLAFSFADVGDSRHAITFDPRGSPF